MKISEIITRIENFHPPITKPEPVDTVKCGDPEKECTGVAITCFASPDVIKKTAAIGANLLIVHEPTFYRDRDETDWLESNPTYISKKKLLDETGIVIWRNHDRIHGSRPFREKKPTLDMLFYGIMQELGWEPYWKLYPNHPLIFEIPETDGRDFARKLTEKFGLNGVRIVGDINTKVRNVFLCEHASGHSDDELINICEEQDIDALLPLEIVDWSLSEYVRDSAQLGRPKLMLEFGHFNLEEIGMKYMEKWLPDVIDNAVPVTYIQSGDSFNYILRE